jgi:hypothetical protein
MKLLNLSPYIKEIKVVKRVKMPPKPAASGLRGGINHILTEFFQKTYSRLCFNLRSSGHYEVIYWLCGSYGFQIVGLWHNVTLMEDDIVELLIIAMVHFVSPRQLSTISFSNNLSVNSTFTNCPEGSIPIIPIQSYAFGFQEKKVQPGVDRQIPLHPLSALNSPSQATLLEGCVLSHQTNSNLLVRTKWVYRRFPSNTVPQIGLFPPSTFFPNHSSQKKEQI